MGSGCPNLADVYVCLCQGVTDRKVRKAIGHGATTVEEVGRACGAGTGCGGCRPEIEAMLCAGSPERTSVRTEAVSADRVPVLSPR
jgi:bacterioferritin-associated ferredoxin